MMRVLVANIPMRSNRFLSDLNTALGKHCDLTHSSDAFWDMEGDFDVVHLHFPEYLTYDIQKAYQTGLSRSLIADVAKRLAFWAARARLVVTRHVLLPHDAVSDPMWESMYETVYSYADGVVHFGQPSVDEFRSRYGKTNFHRGVPPSHVVIPHQNYASLPQGITREEARKALRIPAHAPVMLVFGAIRNADERNLILRTFKAQKRGTILVASRWREEQLRGPPRLEKWQRDAVRLYYRINPYFRFNYSFVSEDDAQTYLGAADVLFIPRGLVLNSGNVTLGMTFGRVVVGPDSWDVGELLRSSGNPVFDPRKPESAAAAVAEGLRLAAEGRVGPANRELALAKWDTADCASEYHRFFKELVASASPSSVLT